MRLVFLLFLLRIGISALSNRLSSRLALALLHRRPSINHTFHLAYSALPGMTLADSVEYRRATSCNSHAGGKGTPRRKMAPKPKGPGGEDPKLQAALKKLQVEPVSGIEEVNMFKEDGNVLHFAAPKGKLFPPCRLASSRRFSTTHGAGHRYSRWTAHTITRMAGRASRWEEQVRSP